MDDSVLNQLDANGFVLLRGIFGSAEYESIAGGLDDSLAECADDRVVLRRVGGAIFGARNLLDVFPPAPNLWRKPRLIALLGSVLGSDCGLVRGLYFDKPPDATWSLPWHQDLTIAVRSHSLPSERFKNPTVKAGIPHVEASDELLGQMLTLRIHLDDATPENGPLQVLPGSHTARNAAANRPPVTILASAGDVLAMRPLLSHCSGVSSLETTLRRRVIHLEFAASPHLPDGYAWHEFHPVAS